MIDKIAEDIIEYAMKPLEILAYKVGAIWLHKSKKTFPDYNHSKGFPKLGDPRNSMIFKICYKLVRETQGILGLEDYALYIQAQLDIIKINSKDPIIDPSCLIGDKAWNRWLVWKNKYDKKFKVYDQQEIKNSEQRIVAELKKTKQFFFGRFEGEPKEEQIMMASTDLLRWISLGKVSYYYALMSPWVKKHCNTDALDMDFHKKSIDSKIKEEFKIIFDYEFISD